MQHATWTWMRGVVAACGLALALLGAVAVQRAVADEKGATAPASGVEGTWQFAEDRTAPEQNRDPRERPPLGQRFKVSFDGKTCVVEYTRRSAKVVSRVQPDGAEDVQQEGATKRTTTGRLDGGVLTLTERRDTEREGKVSTATTEFTLTPDKDGLLVRMQIREPTALERTALFRRAPELPSPKAGIDALAWLAGRFTASEAASGGAANESEEHWGPPGGGAMLGTARSVAGGKMSSFEFLRIVERDGGLVYIAQPGGGTPVEFVLTEISPTRALFENPVNDYPKRILYERLPAPKDGQDGLRTEISDTGGARPHAATYTRTK